MANLLQNWFSDRAFYVTIADADIESLKSLHTLFDKYLDHMLVKFEQRTCAVWPQMVNNFWQNVDTILEDVSVTETIVWC